MSISTGKSWASEPVVFISRGEFPMKLYGFFCDRRPEDASRISTTIKTGREGPEHIFVAEIVAR